MSLKYCLNYSVNEKYLKQADEIKIPYTKLDLIYNKFLDYNCTFIILLDNKKIDWKKLGQTKTLLHDNLILCCNSYDDFDIAQHKGFKAYMNYEVTDFYEFNALIKANAAYIKIGAPLIFQKNSLSIYKEKLRAIPNVAYSGITREESYCGKWIRPEDQELYEDFIQVFEFNEKTTKAEEAMFRIYKIQKEWPGQIKDIIHNFNHDGLNRLVPKDYVKYRLNCGQRCQQGGACHICKTLISLSQESIYANWLKQDKDIK